MCAGPGCRRRWGVWPTLCAEDDDACCSGCGQVQRGVAHARGEEEAEVWEVFQEVAREGGALAHGGDDGEGF